MLRDRDRPTAGPSRAILSALLLRSRRGGDRSRRTGDASRRGGGDAPSRPLSRSRRSIMSYEGLRRRGGLRERERPRAP